MAATDKDTIYIDIDDEITGIIDKVKGSDGKVVALVLPKRAGVFQSIVNMKLLKRAADSSKKHLVLITSEAGLLPLAGAAGIHVAKTLTSKPEIPSAPQQADESEEEVNEDEDIDTTAVPADPNKTVGQLAGADGVETLMLDDEDVPPEADDKSDGPKTFVPPVKKDKKLNIPNFDRFRLLLVGGGLLLILLIFGFVFAATALPKATITIKTDAVAVDTNLKLNLSTEVKTLDTSSNTVPAKLTSTEKTYTQQVPTTGQKNNGQKATGDVTVTNCGPSSVTINAGTGFSSGGKTYLSQDDVTVPASGFNFFGKCKKDGNASVSVVAESGGTSYNMAAGAIFEIATHPAYVTASGGTIAGGTDDIVQVVSANDINSAKSKIKADDNDLKQNLSDDLKKDSFFAVEATYATGSPKVTSSNNVGEAANNVTVTETITYTMFGVHKDDLKTLVENSIKDQIDTAKQGIIDNGLDKATFNVDNLSTKAAEMTMSATATVGPDLDVNTIKENAAGKKPGAVKDDLRTNPDVKDVEVKLSPFWVSSIPKKTSKITVIIAEPENSAKASSSDANNP